MKPLFIAALLLVHASCQAETTGTNTAIHQREQVLKDIESNRRETSQAGTTANTPSTPNRVDTSSWGMDSGTRYDITNHLLGYSVIMEEDQTLTGVKLTGVINAAYYKAETTTSTGRSEGRFVLGFEFPVYDISRRLEAFSGIGATFGDRTGLYLDVGVDFYLTSWAKIQAGVNMNTGYGGIAPQLSAGLTW